MQYIENRTTMNTFYLYHRLLAFVINCQEASSTNWKKKN